MEQAIQEQYAEQGYVIMRNLFTPEEVEFYRRHYMALRAAGAHPGDSAGVDLGDTAGADIGNVDPLKKYPRMIHMHRWDETSLNWMIDERISAVLTALLGREPFAVQTMLYFKPAGARGQALHQDQFYLRVQPGTCMAAWLALDDCDEENGCLQMVPGSQNWEILCTTDADIEESFTEITVELPAGTHTAPLTMKAGDVAFFNGQVVHGSFPNTSRDRFRRALIGHYIVGEAEKVYRYYHPVLRMDGSEVTLLESEDGDTCGRWVEKDGTRVIEVQPKGELNEAEVALAGRLDGGAI